MKIKNILVNVITAISAFSSGLYVMKVLADKKERLMRMKPKGIAPRPGEVTIPPVSPDYLRFGGLE